MPFAFFSPNALRKHALESPGVAFGALSRPRSPPAKAGGIHARSACEKVCFRALGYEMFLGFKYINDGTWLLSLGKLRDRKKEKPLLPLTDFQFLVPIPIDL
jgi:hypothetical protein